MSGRLKEADRRQWWRAAAVVGASAALLGSGPIPVEGQHVHAASPSPIYGPAVGLGQGTVRTYVLDTEGGGIQLGVALSEGALEGLPEAGTHGAILMPDGLSTFEFELPLPEPNPTPYRHVVLDWNPGGHEPPGVYDLAHFDFHFYLVDRDTRMAIDMADPEFWEKAARHPDPSVVPAGYFSPEGTTVPAMGVHWLDAASPELNGETFTRTFIFGSWNGELIFSEPMITRAYLLTQPDETVQIPAAQRPLASGRLPESYVIRWVPEAREYRIGIDLMPTGVGPVGGR